MDSAHFACESKASADSARQSRKLECVPSRCGVERKVRKNCEPLVLGPELAIESVPRSVCFSANRGERSAPVDGREKQSDVRAFLSMCSSSKGLPQVDCPPRPEPVGSPPWSMKPGMRRWKMVSAYLLSRASWRSRSKVRGGRQRHERREAEPGGSCSKSAVLGRSRAPS